MAPAAESGLRVWIVWMSVPPAWRDKAPASWKHYDRSAFDPKDNGLREFLRTQQRGLALVRKAAAMSAWLQ